MRALNWARRVMDWDEAVDGTNALISASRKAISDPKSRVLLEELSDGGWIPERRLRESLGWRRSLFFIVTMRLILLGWVDVRRGKRSLFRSEYRLSHKAWGHS